MKTFINKPCLPVLIAGLCSLLPGQASGQTFTTLHSFTPTATSSSYTNADGARLSAELLLSGNTLYGTAVGGGSSGNGTVFAMNTDGTGFTNLHSFTVTSGGSLSNIKNTDGANPYAGLILSSNTLYGTTAYGGTNGNGTVFALNADGTGFTNLHIFTATTTINGDGANPYARLVLSGNTLYGTAVYGGRSGNGTIFAINTDGTGFTNLHSFTVMSGSFPTKNSDGAYPYAGLILSSNTLYGTTESGGTHGYGAVFAVHTDGTGFTNLHSFNNAFNFRDGLQPFAGLLLSGSTLYGTTESGGLGGVGTVFAVNTDGTSFTNLHSFNQSDGWEPQAGLILSSNTLYGTTTYGGNSAVGGKNGNGSVFAINTDSTGFTSLHNFTATAGYEGGYGTNSDGGYPVGGLVLSSNTLYGTTHIGGSSGSGTIFTISLPESQPQLTILPSALNVILTWPINATGLVLQSATDLGSPVWTTNSTAPVVVNGLNTVTNPISGTQQFFRLSQ
jgi:uncharacterized repeat protein (TIGR03803 family)